PGARPRRIGDRGGGPGCRSADRRRGGPGARRVRGRSGAGRRLSPVRPVLAGRPSGEHRRRAGHGAAGRRGAVAHVRLFRLVRVPRPGLPGPVRGGLVRRQPRVHRRRRPPVRRRDRLEVHDRLRALLTYLPRNANRPRLPSWAVFDEAARRAGPLNGLLGTPNDYAWSPDNSAEVDRGWILAADGPADLAGKMGVDAGTLTG